MKFEIIAFFAVIFSLAATAIYLDNKPVDDPRIVEAAETLHKRLEDGEMTLFFMENSPDCHAIKRTLVKPKSTKSNYYVRDEGWHYETRIVRLSKDLKSSDVDWSHHGTVLHGESIDLDWVKDKGIFELIFPEKFTVRYEGKG